MDSLASIPANIAIGLETALTLSNLFYCFVGVFLGTLLGVIPGIGTMAALSLLYPFTFFLDPAAGLIMLAGIFYGTTYGGSTAAILFNLPGTPATAVTCLDGYPMAQQGRAGVALFMTTVASFFGGSIGILMIMLFSPIIAGYALQFGPAEYFSLMVLGLVAASTISDGSVVKSFAMIVLGILVGGIGTDIYTGVARFNFGFLDLADGITIVALAMGLFGVSEVISGVRTIVSGEVKSEGITFRSMISTRDDIRRSWGPMFRGSAIGSFFGTLPGTGGLIAAFMSYAVEKRVSDDPSRFGKGAIEGIMGPESANNACDQTAFIPTLTLGIPGTPAMAIVLGVLIIQGINPGPTLLTAHPDLFWGLVMSFWIGNLMLLVLNIPLIGLWVRMLLVPFHLLFPAILAFVCLGVFTVNNSPFDLILVIIFGLLGYCLRQFGFSLGPLILGFVLGPLMEEHFRRAMILSRGSFATFFERPISGTILVIAILLIVWAVWAAIRPRRSNRPQ